MHYRTSFYVKEIGLISGLVLVMIALAAQLEVLAWLGVLIEIASVVQALVYYKCPYCKQRFGLRNRKVPNFCPECGHELE